MSLNRIMLIGLLLVGSLSQAKELILSYDTADLPTSEPIVIGTIKGIQIKEKTVTISSESGVCNIPVESRNQAIALYSAITASDRITCYVGLNKISGNKDIVLNIVVAKNFFLEQGELSAELLGLIKSHRQEHLLDIEGGRYIGLRVSR